jgi:hypothetical protein
MLRYQCTMHLCQAASGKNSAALSASPRQASEMISCTPLYGALVVKRDFHCFSICQPFSFLSNSPVRPGGAILPPLVPSAGARSGSQGGPKAQSVLDCREYAGRLGGRSTGRASRVTRQLRPRRNPRRARHWCCAYRAPQPYIRSILAGSYHDAIIRIGGELRGGGSIL